MLNDKAYSENRYEKFFADIFENQKIYTYFFDEKNICISPSNEFFLEAENENEEDEPLPVITFWSEKYKNYGKIFWGLQDDGTKQDVFLAPITLKDFYENWLPQMVEDNVILGINWNDQGLGKEVPPEELLKRIEAYLKSMPNFSFDEPFVHNPPPLEHFISKLISKIKNLFK